MREHGGATRPGMALAIVGAALLAALVLAPAASANAGGPISGDTKVGETLTASSALDYRWQRCDPTEDGCESSGVLWFLDPGWSNIGATSRNYTLTEADQGMMIRVLSNGVFEGFILTVASPEVGPVEGADVPVNTDPPSISGDAIVGSTLTADDGSWQSVVDFETSREWLRSNDSGGFDPIPGATGETYELQADDAGREIALRVVATNSGGASDPATSAAVGPVVGEPVNLGEPSISGSAIEGETLTGDEGEWSGDPTGFERQWQRSNGGGWVDIDGATGSTYDLTVDDVNRRVRLRVVASNAAGDSEPAFSEATDVVTNPPEFDNSGNLDPVSGTVLAKLPGESQVREISELTQVPVGTIVDVTGGFVDLTTQRGPNEGLQTITLWDGAFVFGQRPKNRITVMRLTEKLAGAGSSGRAQAAGSKGKKLWGRGRCRCRTRGRNSSGTARGTWWLTAERKRGTFTKVKEGTVVVRDFTRNRKVKVKAGERYLARSH
jgi:hypothetical protein